VNRLTPLQREAARLLFEIPESAGFALAGGSALVARGVIDRPTRDLEVFIAAQHGDPPGDVRPLVTAYESALVGNGWSVEVIRRHATFARLVATLDGETIEIDLAVDSSPLFPIEHVDDVPTLAPEDLAGRKILAVLDRAEGRDFTDLWILAQRCGRDECIGWAQQLDPGVTDTSIADAFDQLARLQDDELPCPRKRRPDVRQWFAGWSQDLRRKRR
jgi:hypothetical protein